MPPRRKLSIRSTPSTAELEWIGGRLALPGYVTEPAPFRPEMIVWLEAPSGFVVGSELYNPNGPHASFADTFFESARRPLAGRPRRPRRVRVETRALADELELVAREGIEVYVAPTPEIDDLIERMMKQSAGEDDLHSYFEDGRVSKEAVARMFDAASILHRVAPWKALHDGQVVRLDIPRYGIEAACVSIIGNLGESFGLLIFPNLDAFESFAERKQPQTWREGEPGIMLLALEFDAVDDIPPRMCREIDENDWQVTDPDAYPRVVHRDWDGVPRPLTERDVEIATTCAKAFATFYVRNQSLLDPELDEIEPVSMTVEDENDLAVRFTYPYEAFELFESTEAPPTRTNRRPKTGRNEPCPCGSGKKYKKCHLGTEESTWQTGPEPSQQPAPVHAMDEHLIERMIFWAERRFGKVIRKPSRDVRDPASTMSLVLPWMVYGFEIQGRPIVSHFLKDADVDLIPEERRWLEAQEQAWLSVWEVQEVEPGKKLELLDLLTGERRHVHETSASQMLVQRDAILARVVSDGDVHVLCGVHPRPLQPRATADVVKRVRARSRVRSSVERLRGYAAGRKLIQAWEDTAARMDRERQKPPRLRNTDGEDFVLTVDRYRFDPADHTRITERLATVEGMGDPERDAKGVLHYTVVRPGNKQHKSWDNTVIAHLTLAKNKLEVETNSTPRADELRRRIESACGKLLGNRKRQETDQEELMAREREKPGDDTKAVQPPPPEMAEVIRQEKQEYYQNWLDDRIPALRGKTPRQAARLQRNRADLELLIKELENSEARLPEVERIDIGWIRDELGL